MIEGVQLTNVQIAILEAIGRLEERENSASDIAAEAAVTPTTITRELNGLMDPRPAFVQFGAGGLWVITPEGEAAVLDDTLDEES